AVEKIIQTARAEFPNNELLPNTLLQIYLNNNRLTNAFELLGSQIQAEPTNVTALINYSGLKMRAQDWKSAVDACSRVLAVQPDNTFALMNRAISRLELGELENAEKDYSRLAELLPKPPYSVYYGLGEIYFKQRQKNKALQNYQKYLELAPRDSPEMKSIKEKIKLIKRGAF
ncbi:MAG TPA: tetratricopeptide repeat protein, partial [Verrucomicrobiae bacterium]